MRNLLRAPQRGNFLGNAATVASPWRLTTAIILAGLAALNLCAADKTWTGGGTDNNWATADNWGGVAPVDNADALIFAGTARINNTNTLTADWRFSALTFATNAGAFVLNGNRIRAIGAPMAFTNNSRNTQTIKLNVDQMTRASVWDACAGDFIMHGAITGTAANSATSYSTVTKDGLGTLTLGGSNDFSAAAPGLKILNGTVVLDMDAGGWVPPATVLQFGLLNSSGGNINKQGGTLVLRGKSTGTSVQTFGNPTIYDATSIAKIQVDPNGGAGTTITVGNTWTRTGNSFMNVDLSKTGSSLFSAPSLNAGGLVGSWCTVTDTIKTGFTTTNATGQIARNTNLYDWTTSGATNYRTSGTRIPLTGLSSFSTLTIQGGGSISSIYNLSGGAILMEEGAGDYTNACAVFGSTGGCFFHQYSTNGNLILNCGLAASLYYFKTGPGTLVIKKDTSPAVTLNVMEGPLDLQATLSNATSVIRVFNGGRLQGSGTFGIGNITNILTVFPGGTLVGTRTATNALSINGYLILQDKSTFAVDLANSAFNPLRVTGTITNLGANLAVTLGYAPGGMDEITLMTSDTGINGTFSSVNGIPFGANDRFALTNNAQVYQFKLLSTSTSVVAQVVTKAGTLIMVR
jgi:autotransporter-associated beta strand protein